MSLWFYRSCSVDSLLAGQLFIYDRALGCVDQAGAVIAEEINFICTGKLKDSFRREII